MEGNNNGQPFLEYDKHTWWTQFFFDKRISQKANLFIEGDVIWKFGGISETEGSVTTLPVSVFVNFYPTTKFTTYVFTQFAPTVAKEFASFYTQVGLGVKYQVTDWMELETSYTNFIIGNNAGAGQTFNLGFRFVRLKKG